MHERRKHELPETKVPSPADKPRNEPMLPIAGNAYVSPLGLSPVRASAAKRNYTLIALALVGGALLAAGIVGMALLVRGERTEAAARARSQLAALRAETPAETSIRIPAPRISKPPPAVAGSNREVVRPAAGAATAAAANAEVARPTLQPLPVASEEPERSRSTRAERKRRASPPAPALPHELTRDQVIEAMRKVTPAVNKCFGDAGGKVKATFSVVGKTGRIVGARVTGGKPASVNSCVSRTLYRARFPKFAKSRIKITYPFAR